MNHHKRRVGVPRIPQDVFQVQDVTFRKIKIIADAHRRMNVDGQVKPSAFADQEPENVILKRAIFRFCGNTPGNESLVNVFGLLAGWIGEFRRAEICHFKLDGNAALLLVVFQSSAHKREVIAEICRQLGHAFLLHPAAQHLLLQWDINLLIGIACGLALVVKGPQEGIAEEYP